MQNPQKPTKGTKRGKDGISDESHCRELKWDGLGWLLLGILMIGHGLPLHAQKRIWEDSEVIPSPHKDSIIGNTLPSSPEPRRNRFKQAEGDPLPLRQAEAWFASNRTSRALAVLAAALRNNPSNQLAADRLLDVTTRQPLGEPLRHDQPVKSARCDLFNQRIIITLEDGTQRSWDLPLCATPVPAWLPELAQAVAGLKLDHQIGEQIQASSKP